MSSRSRSKSPARKTRANPVSPPVSPAAASPVKAAPAAAGGSPLDDPNVQTGVALAVLVGVWSLCAGGELSLSGFGARVQSGFEFDVPTAPVVGGLIHSLVGPSMNFILTLHVLNSITSSVKGVGGWLNSFTSTIVATFAGVIAPAVLGGGSTLGAIFADPHSTMSLTRFFATWYILNYDIPGCPVNFGLWNKFASICGEPLNILLNFGTAMFSLNLVVAASGAAGAHAMLSAGWFGAIAAAVVAGTAHSFFPLNKGFSLKSSAAGTEAFAVAFFIASNGFAVIDWAITYALSLVGDLTLGNVNIDYSQAFGSKINDAVTGPFGGVVGFVVTVTALNHLVGHLIPVETGKGFDLFGVVGKVFKAVQLE